MTYSCLQKKDVYNDPFKHFHSCPRKHKIRNKRERYYDGNVLCIKIGDRTFRYPPKGGVIIFNMNNVKNGDFLKDIVKNLKNIMNVRHVN